jgi:PhoD-like phosphatase
LIGRDAARDVFGHISDFLKDALVVPEPASEVPATQYYLRRPLIGPLIGWLRPANAQQQDVWQARIWCRLDDQRSPVSSAVVLVRKQGRDRLLRVIRPTAANQEDKKDSALELLLPGPMDTVLCVDVTLDGGPGAYDVSVLSVHEAAQVSDEYRKAESDAGFHPSEREPHLRLQPGQTLERKLAVPGALDEYFARRRRHIRHGVHDDKVDQATVQVPDAKESSSVTFAVASCRYPGWLIDRQRADAAFGQLRTRLDRPDNRPSALFLIGDQIYADATAGIFDPKSRRERFYEAYREAWTAPNARDVLSRLPVYMMMDDHEAGNDWHPDDFLSEEDRKMRDAGVDAFTRYQWLHSPGCRPTGAWEGAFRYKFDLQGFPVFVCDTRSGRSGRRRILDERQFLALVNWLCDAQARDDATGTQRPKIVVSPSVVVPFRKPLNKDGTGRCPTRSDSWDGFQAQTTMLFAFIARHRINNVVFLCGDSHLSMCTDITFVDRGGNELVDETASQPLRACCILASPMYGPYPFVNPTPNEFEHEHPTCLKLPNVGAMRYIVRGGMRESGFTTVTLARNAIGAWSARAELEPVSFGAPQPPRSIELMAEFAGMPT